MRHILVILFAGFAFLQQAAAQTAICSGESLVAEIERDRPDVWAAALKEFDAIPNGTGLFWRIERPGLKPSWLLGTMHVPDSTVTTLKEPVAQALAKVDAIVLESTEVVDPERNMQLAAEMMTLAQIPDGGSFDADFSRETKSRLGAMSVAHGMPYFMARRLKPWFLAIMLSLPPCTGIAALQGEPVLDEKLYLEALEAGKEVHGLETAAEQLAVLTDMDEAIGADALLEVVDLGMDGVEDWYATLIDLYLEERVALIDPLLDEMPEFRVMAQAMKNVEGSLVTSRNVLMHERLLPYLEDGSVFVGVGALHLSGESGLVELLRGSGFAVTRVE